MSRKRKAIPLSVQLAAALCQLGKIELNRAKMLTPEQVRSLFDLHHWPIPHAWGGDDVDKHWNLEFRFRSEHRIETAKQAPAIAKVRRAEKKRERVNVCAFFDGAYSDLTPEQSVIERLERERQMDRAKHKSRKMQGRGFPERIKATHTAATDAKPKHQPMPGSKASGWKRKLNGQVERRTRP